MEETEQTNKNSTSLELLDFWAIWCGPCKIMDPILHEIEHEYEGKLAVKRYNVDEEANQALVQKHNVMSIPTYILIKEGEIVATFVGTQPKSTITSKLDELLNKNEE